MEQALKQRLVGALVITALAAIFVPMFFEDSVDDTRREVNNSDLAIPAPPEQLQSEDNPIPQTPQQVLHATEDEAAASDAEASAETAAAPDESANQAAPQEETEQPPTPEQTERPAAIDSKPATVAAPIAAAVTPPAKPKLQAVAPTAQTKPAPTPAAAKSVKAQPVVPPPVPAQVAAPAPKPAAAQSAAPAPQLQRWVLQLGSFAKKENADALVAKLRSQGFNAYGDSIQVAGKGSMFRVRIGPELDKKRAQGSQKKLQQSGQNSILLSE